MACKYLRENGNVVGALAPNGKESDLFRKLKKATGSITKAKTAYDYFRSDKFKKWFGKDWEAGVNTVPLVNSETLLNIYAGTGENANLSNLANRPFKVGEDTFNTVEGAFQATKIAHTSTFTQTGKMSVKNKVIFNELKTATGVKAKSLGRTITELDVNGWNKVSANRMKTLIKQSFEQNPDAIQKLLATGNATLTHTQDKGKWGKLFPKVLMKVRSELAGNHPSQQTSAMDSFYIDGNGEPLMIAARGEFVVMNSSMESEVVKDAKNTIHTSGMGAELESNLTRIIVQMFKDNKDLPGFDANTFFNPEVKGEDKGLLADALLEEAFENVELEKAKELFKIYKLGGQKALLRAMKEENISFNEVEGIGPAFIKIYNEWEDVVSPVTGNLDRTGWRTRIAAKLEELNYSLRDDAGEIYDIDDTPVRIHNISRLQEDPKTKLSSKAKEILSNINSEAGIYGYAVDLEMADVYSAVAEATVGEMTYTGMIHKMENIVKYKPTLAPILNRLKSATAQEQASLFSNFAMAYKNFLLIKAKKEIKYDPQLGGPSVTISTSLMSSNQSDTGTKAIQDWANVSKEYDTPNERALYKVTANELGEEVLTVSKKKKAAITKAFDKIDNATINKRIAVGPVPAKAVEGLAEFLWEIGVSYGPTLESTRENLTRYFEIGDIRKNKVVTGMPLFTEFMNGPATKKSTIRQIRGLKNIILKDGPATSIYSDQRSILQRLSSISYLFEDQPFGSFISGTNKQYWPINQPTPLDELQQTIKSPERADAFLMQLLKDPMNNPGSSSIHTSPLIQALHHGQGLARDSFKIEVVDSYKGANESIATTDYSNQSEKVSLIVRLNAFANRGDKELMKIAIPTQADRQRLDFVTIPRYIKSVYKNYGVTIDRRTILESIIIQDLARMNQAKAEINKAIATKDFSQLVEGYHYFKGQDPDTGITGPKIRLKDGSVIIDKTKRGTAFTMPQIQNLENTLLEKGLDMSDEVFKYINDDSTSKYKRSKLGKVFQKELNKKVEALEANLEQYKTDVQNAIDTYGINLFQDIDSNMSLDKNFISDFVFNDFVGRTELNKLYRGGMSYSKNPADFYKRAGLLNTPGTKLFIKGMTEQGGGEYGMMPTYNETVIKDFDFINKKLAHAIADNMFKMLVAQGVPAKKAEKISNSYRPKSIQNPGGVNKTDAQGFISIDMYRGIMMGLGKWDMKLDEAAYKREKKGLGFNRPIYPVKPYHEELMLDNGRMTMYMNKNSYVTITKELAANMPMLEKVRRAMDDKGIHVVNVESATKGARKNVLDLQAGKTFDDATITTMDSTKLRIPQQYNSPSKGTITFSRQIRKNLITNLDRTPNSIYTLDKEPISGNDMYNLYQETLAVNIAEDTKELDKILKKPALRKAVKGTKEYADAKLEHLKAVREEIKKQLVRKDLPSNYLDALNIVPEGQHDWGFEIPLAFPNYQAKFEQIFFGIYNDAIFNQKLKGIDLVQIAELGGSEEDSSNELKFYDGENLAEVKVRASTLGLPPGTKIEDVDPALLTILAYRTPNQLKSSSLIMKVVEFLPESHAKAIMVPGGITVQMGADFDIDKLSIVLRQTKMVKDENGKNVLTKISPDYSNKDLSKMSREERDNIFLDIAEAILTDPKHLEEVVTPLDSERLEYLAEELRESSSDIDYNNPLSELEMESRNKDGQTNIGLWSNMSAGRNVAETSPVMTVHEDYAPVIRYGENEITFNSIGKTREYDPITNTFSGDYTSTNISMYQSTAVDAAKNPIQIDLNDNKYTVPVAGLMLSNGVPVDDVVYFLAQPAIKALINQAKIEQKGLGKLLTLVKSVTNDSINELPVEERAVLRKRVEQINSNRSFIPMRSEQLQSLDESDIIGQAKYLHNFGLLFKAGRQLQTVYKIITPDNISNVNEIASLVSYLDTENTYLQSNAFGIVDNATAYRDVIDTKESVIQGAAELIVDNQSNDKNPLNALVVAYRGILDTMLEAGEEIGFINNRPSFYNFKNILKKSINQHSLSSDQHKFIDKMLFLDMMTRPESPFVKSKLISKKTFESLYTNPTSNIITKLNNIKIKYPKLATNKFVELLKPDVFNQEKNNGVYLIKMETLLESSANSKNIISNALLTMVTNPGRYANDKNNIEELNEIKQFAKIIVANQLYTKGFTLGAGTYMDLIPSQFLSTNMLFEDQDSPVTYYLQAAEGSKTTNYFTDTDFMHTFVRNFGTLKPGGFPLLPSVPYKEGKFRDKKNKMAFKETVFFTQDDSTVFDANLQFTDYFITNPQMGDPMIYVRTSISSAGIAGYQMLQTTGLPGKLSEVGITQSTEDSMFTRSGKSILPTKAEGRFVANNKINSMPEFVLKPIKDVIEQFCKI
jgi:predicted NAD-dependent protein-ADP-ribosyltransferase YbiA (DUF1768 family)